MEQQRIDNKTAELMVKDVTARSQDKEFAKNIADDLTRTMSNPYYDSDSQSPGNLFFVDIFFRSFRNFPRMSLMHKLLLVLFWVMLLGGGYFLTSLL
jgi:hypothetical protein